MHGEAVSEFRCGSSAQASKVANGLECMDCPKDLRTQFEWEFGDLKNLVSVVSLAVAREGGFSSPRWDRRRSRCW